MIRFLADEDFDNDIIRGLLHRRDKTDITRVQDEGLSGEDDSAVLEWSASNGRVLLTHDVNTMTAEAYNRLESGLHMPGIIVVPQSASIGIVIDDLCLIADCSEGQDWEGQVRYLSLQ